MSVSSGDNPGVISVSGNGSDTSAPGITYEQLQEAIQEIPVMDSAQSEYLLAGINDRLTVVVLFGVVCFVYAISKAVYRFFNGLFG